MGGHVETELERMRRMLRKDYIEPFLCFTTFIIIITTYIILYR